MRWNQIIYKYQTAPVTPAPYAHFYTLTLRTDTKGTLQTSLEMTYTDREDLDESEISDEGFTGNDDVNWEGKLPGIWLEIISRSLQKLPGKISPARPDSEMDEFHELIVDSGGKELVIENAKDLKNWNYTAQEIIQAIFEASGKEKSFEMDYTRIADGKENNLQFKASFLHREFSVVNLDTKKTKQLPWDDLHHFLGTVFGAEFRPDLITGNERKQPGHHIRTGDELWYKLGTSVLDPNGGTKALKKIERLLEEFI